MTAQFSEILFHRGEKLTLCSVPLGPFLENAGSSLKLKVTSSALWRGYVGTWVIESDRLYLKALQGHTPVGDWDDGVVKAVGLEAVFPCFPQGVFAHWFTGELRCPSGALLKYVHGGFGSTYEKDVFIRVRRGVVLDERTVVNGVAAPDAEAGYFLAGYTSSGDVTGD